jgi:creatinine amidohydrolase/Fe(II)-dependent formamide hydrolase-like protein
MCRIWISGVPPGNQPAPTDCASAVRNRPANGKVLFGDDPSKAKAKSNKKKSSNATDELVDLIKRGISK